MNLQASFQTFKETLVECYEHPERPYALIAVKLRAWRNDPEFFQKICQVVFAALLIKIENGPKPSSLARFANVFSTANLQDAYRLFKLPYHFLFPVTLGRIRQTVLLNSLVKVLCDHFQTGYVEDENGLITDVDDDNIIHFAKAGLEMQFQVMNRSGDAYRSTDEFNEVLERRFKGLHTIHRAHEGVDTPYDFEDLDLGGLEVPLTSPSLIEKLEDFNWIIVNCGCLFLYLRDWDLISTAQWAEKLGRTPAFSWLRNQLLEAWVRGIVCTAYCLKFCEAVRQLRNEELTEQGLRKAHWTAVGSFFEILSNGAAWGSCNGYWKINQTHLQILVIIAKGIGLMEIMTRPPMKFFEGEEKQS